MQLNDVAKYHHVAKMRQMTLATGTVAGKRKIAEIQGLIVTSNYFVLRWGRERCDRKGHAVFLRP